MGVCVCVHHVDEVDVCDVDEGDVDNICSADNVGITDAEGVR